MHDMMSSVSSQFSAGEEDEGSPTNNENSFTISDTNCDDKYEYRKNSHIQ